MRLAVQRDLVAAAHRLGDERGAPEDGVAEHEEGGADAGPVERVEDRGRVLGGAVVEGEGDEPGAAGPAPQAPPREVELRPERLQRRERGGDRAGGERRAGDAPARARQGGGGGEEAEPGEQGGGEGEALREGHG